MIAVVMDEEEYPQSAFGYYIAPDVAVDEIINTDDIDKYMFDVAPTWEYKRTGRTPDEQSWETEWSKLKNEYDYVFVLPITEEWEETGERPMFSEIYFYHNGKRHVNERKMK